MTLSHQKPPNPVRTSVEGTVDVSGAFSIGGVIDVSGAGGAISVSANGGGLNVTIVNVSANIPASVRNTVDVSARQIDVSAHGVVSAAGHVLVSADGHVLVSGDGTFNSAIVNVSGSVPVSVLNTINVSAVGGVFNVSAQGGALAVNLVNASGGAVAVSVRNTIDVSARQIDVSAHGVVSAAGRVSTYFALPASHITDGNQSETRTVVNVSGASAGNYALVSAPASGVTRVTRLMLTFTSATFVTFRGASAATSSINYTGPMRVLDGGSIVLDKSDSPWFVTTGAKNFSVNVSAGVGIAGAVWYY